MYDGLNVSRRLEPRRVTLSWAARNLSPLSPCQKRLSPLLVGTVFSLCDKDLRAFFAFVPTVPTKFRQGVEGCT